RDALALDQLDERVSVPAEAEEVVAFGNMLRPRAVLGAKAVPTLALAVELLAADAVESCIGRGIDVAVRFARAPKPLDRRRVPRVGARAEKVVAADVERVGKRYELRRLLRDEASHRNARLLGG